MVEKKEGQDGFASYLFTIADFAYSRVDGMFGCTLCRWSCVTAIASSSPCGVVKVNPQAQSKPSFSVIATFLSRNMGYDSIGRRAPAIHREN